MLLAEGANSSLANLLSASGELFTWLITQMTALITFIMANPVILIPFLITFAGLVVGMFMRIAH